VTPKSFLRRTAALIALVMSGSVMAADPVVVSSKIDTEGSVLGQMVLQSLEGAGIPVENRLQLGGTSIVRNAIKAGEIDIYPEYTGNAAFFHDQADRDIWKDADKAYQEAARLDKEAHNIVWLQPAEANNTWAMSVRGIWRVTTTWPHLRTWPAISMKAVPSSLRPAPSLWNPPVPCQPSRRPMASSLSPTSC